MSTMNIIASATLPSERIPNLPQHSKCFRKVRITISETKFLLLSQICTNNFPTRCTAVDLVLYFVEWKRKSWAPNVEVRPPNSITSQNRWRFSQLQLMGRPKNGVPDNIRILGDWKTCIRPAFLLGDLFPISIARVLRRLTFLESDNRCGCAMQGHVELLCFNSLKWEIYRTF